MKPISVSQDKFYQDNLIWIITYVIDCCNFQCPYCYNHKPRTGQLLDLIKLEEFIDHVQAKTGYNVYLELIGGEPTLHPGLLSFVKKMSAKIYMKRLKLFSNMSQDICYYKKVLPYVTDLFASWHSQCKDYIQKIKVLAEFKEKMSLCIMLEEDNWMDMLDVFTALMPEFKEQIDPSLVSETDYWDKENSLEHVNWYKCIIDQLYPFQEKFQVKFDIGTLGDRTFGQMYMNDDYCFKHWKCDAGLRHLYVHSDGNVFKCQSYYDNRDKKVGTIYEPDLIELKPTFCKFDTCSCTYCVKKEKLA